MSEPRFYVHEHSGHKIRVDEGTGGDTRFITEVMVIDSHYCHEVIRSWGTNPSNEPRRGQYDEPGHLYVPVLTTRRRAAAALCETLNEWALAVA